MLASFRTKPLRTSARVPDDRLPLAGRVTQGWARALTTAGVPLSDRDSLAREVFEIARRMQTDGRSGRALVASIQSQRPDNRTLDS